MTPFPSRILFLLHFLFQKKFYPVVISAWLGFLYCVFFLGIAVSKHPKEIQIVPMWPWCRETVPPWSNNCLLRIADLRFPRQLWLEYRSELETWPGVCEKNLNCLVLLRTVVENSFPSFSNLLLSETVIRWWYSGSMFDAYSGIAETVFVFWNEMRWSLGCTFRSLVVTGNDVKKGILMVTYQLING